MRAQNLAERLERPLALASSGGHKLHPFMAIHIHQDCLIMIDNGSQWDDFHLLTYSLVICDSLLLKMAH